MSEWLNKVQSQFIQNVLEKGRYKYILSGLQNTLKITFFALILGVTIGVIVASVRSTYDKNYRPGGKGFGKVILKVLNSIANIYLIIIRGTPVVVQLMIMYYVIFANSKNGVLIAILAFGINSGAYVAEIVRGGIMSVDTGQEEAGRSLGFNYIQTMRYIIVPQALKNVLPALANEFIVLLKETSVAGYVAVHDLTKGGDIIRSQTYSPMFPLFIIAFVYLVLVMFFTWLVSRLERRLRNNER